MSKVDVHRLHTKEYPSVDERLVLELAEQIQLLKEPSNPAISWEAQKKAAVLLHERGFAGALDELFRLREARA
jgi:hypothetical protein